MNIIETIPMEQQHNDNETVTLLALPLQIFQQASQQHSLIVEQNLVFKSLPDGTLIIDTNQLLDRNNIPLSTPAEISESRGAIPTDNVEEVVVTIEHKTEPNIPFYPVDLPKKGDTSRNLTRKPGRPRKDGTIQQMNDITELLKCRYCDKEFKKWLLYRRHEKSHHNDNKYKCTSCSAAYNILSNYLLHLATHNTTDPTCPECGKKFQRIASLKAHLMYHEKEETFYCEECDMSFNNEVEVNNHLKEHGKEKRNETETLKCKHCQIVFSVQLDYKKHMSEHSKMRSILQVPSRKKPRKTMNSTDLKHQCVVCNKCFQKRSQIERHLRVHSGEKPYVCKICNRGFSQKGSLQIHMTKHTGLKPHKCALCPAKFSQKGNLRAHIVKTHSVPRGDEHVFSCSECSCVFKRLATLNGHVTRNHPKQKNNEYRSVMAQLATLQHMTLLDNDILQQAILRSELQDDGQQQHVNCVSKEEENTMAAVTYVTLADLGVEGTMRQYIIKQRITNDIRWYMCSFCTKEFKKPSDLVRHLRVHTREKPYKCKLCLRSFAVKSTLTTHIKTHTKINKVQCKFCYKYFSSFNSLNMHIRKHVAQKPHRCSICNKAFRSTVLLKQHFHMHLANETNTLYTHDTNTDVIMQQPIHVTNKGLQSVGIPLKKRPLVEAGCKFRPYKCLICTAAFRKMSHLKQHHMRHTGERPFRCHLCFRNFFSSGILKSHLLTHNGTKPYKCVLCEKHFATNGSLRRHQQSHTSATPYLCPYCYKHFKTVLSCRRHMKIHKLEINLQLQAAKQCGISTDVVHKKPSELPYAPDLSDTLGEDPFPLLQGHVTTVHQEAPDDDKTHIVTQTLRADESGTIVLPMLANQENFTQENMREIEDSLNNQMINIIGGSDNFVDTTSSSYGNKINVMEPIASTDELVNTLSGNEQTPKMEEENPFFYPHVIVNMHSESERIPIFDNTGIDNILSQVKLQNDPLFLAHLNSLNISETNNVLLPFQITPQTEQNQMISSLAPPPAADMQPTLDLETIHPNNNLHLKLNVINSFVQTSHNLPDANHTLTNNSTTESNTEFLNAEADAQITKLIESDTVNEHLLKESSVLQTDAIDITCSLCKLQFKSRTEMKLHECSNLITTNNEHDSAVDIDENNEMIISNVTSLTNEVFQEYVTHKEKHDQSQNTCPTSINRNQCTYCTKSFRKPSDLQRHIRTHTGERPYKCLECAKSFSLKSTLESHTKVHQGKKEFTCHVCNCLFATKGSLSVHMRLHTGVKPFKCPLCLLKFRTSGHRKAHLTVHYKEALRTGKVPSEVVTKKAKISELMLGVEDLMRESLPKKDENKEIPAISEVGEHVTEDLHLVEQGNLMENIILESANDPLMQFEVQTDEQGHVVNIKPASSKMLVVNVSIKNQMMSSELEFDEKTRMQIEDLIRENATQNNINQVKKKAKRTCNICQKEFSTKYLLDRHIKIHTGEKVFSCTHCTKTFNQKNSLEAHMRTHLGTRPYTCPYCSNAFSQSGNLKTHIKRIHCNNVKADQNQSATNELRATEDLYRPDLIS